MYSEEEIAEKWMVFGHILRREKIFRASKKVFEESTYFEGFKHIEVALELASDFYEEYGGMITKDAFFLEWPIYRDDAGIEDTTFVLAKLHEWFDKPSDQFSDGYIQKVLENMHKTGVAESLQSQLMYEDDPTKAQEFVRKASERIGSSLFTDVQGLNPFDNLEANLAVAELHPWGIDFLDGILDGGSAPGEMIGILMVSGGGKTTLGIQTLAAHVRRGEHIVYFSTEQDLAGDMTIRMMCHALNCSRNEMKRGLAGLKPKYKEMLPSVQPKWKKYCHFVELAHKPIHTLDVLFEYIEGLHDQGIYPTSIVIDWWGRLKDALVETNLGNGEDNNSVRMASRRWLHTLRSKGGELGVKIMVLHQLSGAVAERSHAHRPSSHSAQEDKNFNNMFDYCFTASRKDEDDECDFIADKARKGGNERRRIRLNGEMCKFESVGNPSDNIAATSSDVTAAGGSDFAQFEVFSRPPEDDDY